MPIDRGDAALDCTDPPPHLSSATRTRASTFARETRPVITSRTTTAATRNRRSAVGQVAPEVARNARPTAGGSRRSRPRLPGANIGYVGDVGEGGWAHSSTARQLCLLKRVPVGRSARRRVVGQFESTAYRQTDPLPDAGSVGCWCNTASGSACRVEGAVCQWTLCSPGRSLMNCVAASPGRSRRGRRRRTRPWPTPGVGLVSSCWS